MNILVVYKKSTVDYYSVSPDETVRRFIASDHRLAVGHRLDHEENARNLEMTLATLDRIGLRYEAVHRATMGCADGKDLVIAVGGDGTFLDAAHHTGTTPIMGVKSNLTSSDGVLLPYRASTIGAALERLDREPRHTLARRQLTIDGVPTGPPALNDILYSDRIPSGSTNCLVRLDDKEFVHRNGSGILVSTATGSTAFIWNEGATPLPIASDRILVHERSRRGAPHLIGDAVEIESWSREGIVGVDGSHLIYPAGLLSVVRFEPYPVPLTFIGDLERQRRRFMV